MCRTKSPRISWRPHFSKRLFLAERVAEIHGAREVLLRAIEAMRREQFLGAENAERVEELGADLVLPAVAARRRHERHARAEMPRVERQRGVVLVVGMRGQVCDRADRRQLAQGERQRGRARQVGERTGCGTGERAAGRRPASAPLPSPPAPRPGIADILIESPRKKDLRSRYRPLSMGFGQPAEGEAASSRLEPAVSRFRLHSMPATPPEASVTRFSSCAIVAFALLCALGLAAAASAQPPPAKPSSDLRPRSPTSSTPSWRRS